MKTNNIIKSFICIVLMLILCLAATSCSNNAGYSIVNKDGQTYIVFDDISQYSIDESRFHGSASQELQFASIKELKDTVTQGKLTDSQKTHIATVFKKDENNAVKTCDFDELYNAKLPDGVSASYVLWNGETYGFALNFDNDAIYGVMQYLTPSSYKNIFDRNYENLFEGELVHVTETKDLGNGKTATYYYTSSGEFENIRYSINIDGKTVLVDKRYTLAIEWSDMKVSSTVPCMVDLYCDEGDKCWKVFLTDFTKDPTDEWLSQFGLTPYVETDAVIK